MWRNYSDPVFRKASASPGAEGMWPVTEAEVYVGCIPEVGPMTTMIVVNGQPFALNGLTKGTAKQGVDLEVDGHPRPVSHEDFPSWWRIGKETPRVGLGPLFDVARDMGCLDFPTTKK